MLVNCLKCNHKISHSAKFCPKCQTPDPVGVYCPICNGQLLSTAGVKLNNECVYHDACLKLHYEKAQLNCNECNATLSINHQIDRLKLGNRLKLVCQSCGSTDPIGGWWNCNVCHLPVYYYEIYTRVDSYGLGDHTACLQK